MLKQVQRSAAQLAKCSQVTVLSQPSKPRCRGILQPFLWWCYVIGGRSTPPIDETTTKILRETGISCPSHRSMHVGRLVGMGV